ncbi:hypothetical protein, partial [Arsenophonus sp.]|uniref:hypothetical protein n=1 Tax=Arsenophonus sp. TaxID=1872640 RepID=UPI0038792C6D
MLGRHQESILSHMYRSVVTDHAKLIRYFIRTQYNGVLASQIRHDLLIQVIYELKCDVTGSGWA